jgi:hypothetical protein
VRLGASRGMLANLVPRTIGSVPNPKTFGIRLDGCPRGGNRLSSRGQPVVLAGATYHVFKFTLQGLNQSIVGLSLLSETA